MRISVFVPFTYYDHKNILIRRKKSDTYLAIVRKLSLQLMKASVLAESYTFYLLSSRPADSSDVY